MRHILKKITVFTIPFVLLFAVFFCFEPYDYFALREKPQYQKEPLSAMRLVMRKKPERIILGDSRMANLNIEYINELTGGDYARLAWGGAQTGESIDMFWFAAERCELKQVIFGINFYTSKGTQIGEENRYDSMALSAPYAKNIFKFATNIHYWLKTLADIKHIVTNPIYRMIDREDLVEIPEDPARLPIIPDPEMGEKWRLNMEVYADGIQKGMVEYDFQPETYAALQQVIDYCDENSIELIFVLPPVHEVIYERVIEVNGMQSDLWGIKDFLIARATVYDFELRTDFASDEDTFYDGFHLMYENKLLFARLIFTNTTEHPELVNKYIKNGVAVIPEHLGSASSVD